PARPAAADRPGRTQGPAVAAAVRRRAAGPARAGPGRAAGAEHGAEQGRVLAAAGEPQVDGADPGGPAVPAGAGEALGAGRARVEGAAAGPGAEREPGIPGPEFGRGAGLAVARADAD